MDCTTMSDEDKDATDGTNAVFGVAEESLAVAVDTGGFLMFDL